MFIVAAGGGKLGYYLVKTLLPFKHKITLIEPKLDVCEKIANELNIMVINGDATKIDDLSKAETDKADIYIAITGRDEDNLISCQLAKKNFGVKRTIARVNNPKNIAVFEKLGVDIAVSSTSIIADMIEQEVDYSGIRTLMRLKNGRVVISEMQASKDSPVCNRSLKEINLPKGCIVISVIRDGEVIIPNGKTVILEGDYIVAVSSEKDQQKLREYFIG